jgi:hypothetical protein
VVHYPVELGGAGFFWPAFPMPGLGMCVLIHAWTPLATAETSEARIQQEIDRLAGQAR